MYSFPIKILLLSLVLHFVHFCEAEDILGCGGFVKSDIDINFSRVEVKLYTKQGSLKDYTDCAPNNGYYFLPLYDKGEYVLKIEPPEGWSFEPKEVNLVVDGSTDKCSQGKDINFVFKGFAVTGKVAPGSVPLTNIQGCDKSPLKGFKSSGAAPLCHVNSDEKGQFTFPSLPPGPYKVVPHYEGPHSIKFDVRPVEVLFTVEHKSLKIDTEFKVKGFSVSGRVLLRAGGEGIAGAVILLDGKSSSVTKADGSYHLENMQAGSYVLQVQA
ncbi:hypothetical protein L9F63_025943, partial [Diploptera punctata]